MPNLALDWYSQNLFAGTESTMMAGASIGNILGGVKITFGVVLGQYDDDCMTMLGNFELSVTSLR